MVEVQDTEVLSRFFLTDPITNAYQLGDLDPAYFGSCRWFADRADDDMGAVALLYQGLSLPALLTTGDADVLAELLREVRNVLPERFQYQVADDHIDALELFFSLRTKARMLRMALRADAYIQPDDFGVNVVRLGHRDTAMIAELYQHYPDNFFEPYQLESGLYFGVKSGDRLVSIAGIHVVSEQYDVAAIGNLVTAPDSRGQGLATACTARLLDELFERVSLVALNTGESNEPAIRTFKRLGFTEHMRYLEGRIER